MHPMSLSRQIKTKSGAPISGPWTSTSGLFKFRPGPARVKVRENIRAFWLETELQLFNLTFTETASRQREGERETGLKELQPPKGNTTLRLDFSPSTGWGW